MKSIREIYKVGKGPSSHTMGPERAAQLYGQNIDHVEYARRGGNGTPFRADLRPHSGLVQIPVLSEMLSPLCEPRTPVT